MAIELAEAKAKAKRDWDPAHPFYGYAHNIKGAHCEQYSYADYLVDMDPSGGEDSTVKDEAEDDLTDGEHESD